MMAKISFPMIPFGRRVVNRFKILKGSHFPYPSSTKWAIWDRENWRMTDARKTASGKIKGIKIEKKKR
jgi:hypothetical protein